MNTISQSIIESLGATLLHSLWQGLVIVLLLSFLLKILKHKSPQFKYFLSCISLLGLVTWMSSTFFNHFTNNFHPNSEQISGNFNPTNFITGNLSGAINWQENLENYFSSFIELYSSELVFIWFVGVLLFGLKWTGAFYYTFSLKRNNTSFVPLKWQNKVKQLSYNLGINKKINILESAKVDVPMVIGYLKPVILIPTSAFTGFTADQLEAVIVHELAHIKNNDFLINMILSALEVVLFYHPAYWFIYKVIMQERENHCDDIAVAHIGNPRLYAETLFNMEKIRQQHSLAMALQGNKNQLLERIKRICIVPSQQYKGGFNKSGIAMGFLFILAIISLAKVPLDAKETILIPLTEEIKEAFVYPVENDELDEEKELILLEEDKKINSQENNSKIIDAIEEQQDDVFYSAYSSLVDDDKNTTPSQYDFLVLTEKEYMQTKAIHPILKNNYEEHLPFPVYSVSNNTVALDSIPDSEKITLTIVSEVDKKGNNTLTYYKKGKVTKRIFIEKNKAKYKLNGVKQEIGNRTFELRKGDKFSIKGTMQISDLSDRQSSIKADEIIYSDDIEIINGPLFNEDEEIVSIHSKNSDVRIIEKSNGDFIIEERDENGKVRSQKRVSSSDKDIIIYEDEIERIHQQAEKEHEKAEKEHRKMEQLHRQVEMEHRKMEKLHRQAEIEHEKSMKIHEKNMEKHEESMRKHEENMKAHDKQMILHEKKRVNDDKFHNSLLKELIKDKLIKNKKKVDFSLTNGKLKINGKRVHDKYHTKYKKMYEDFYGEKMKSNSTYRFTKN